MLRRNVNFILLAFLLDLIGIFMAVFVAYWLRLHLPFGRYLPYEPYLLILIAEAFLIYVVIFVIFAIYDPDQVRTPIDEYQQLTKASLVASLALAGLVYFTARDISRLLLIYFYSLHFLALFGWRAFGYALRSKRNKSNQDQGNILVVGGGDAIQQVINRLGQFSWAGIRIVGYLDDEHPIADIPPSVPRLGSIEDIVQTIQHHNIHHVLISFPAHSHEHTQELVTILANQPCNIWIVPDYFNLMIYGSRVEDLGGVPMISLKSTTLTGYQRLVKRSFDIIFSLIFMLPATLLSLLISLAIKLDSPGPVIIKQTRVGENGRLFGMYKFRSMVQNAEENLEEVIKPAGNGNLIHKFPDDPRVTRVGKWIRRTSLDEIPQLMNVLTGDMSLVGPRPELPRFVAHYQSWQQKRFAVPQGITGWWQVNGRSELPMHLNTEYDLYYVQNYSLLLDIQILIKTGWVVVRGIGAY